MGTPSSLSVWCSRTSPRTAAGLHWALRRPGGRRSAHRRTIPRRRSAAPSRQGERPFVGCGIAAKPARRSPQAAANRQRLPPRVGAPAVAAPRGESGSKADEAAHAAALRPEAAGSVPPLPCWQPRHPSPRTPAAQQRAGCFRSVAPAARPPCWPVSHSLSGPRRCPRSMTPGTAAAPAPGCWLRCLRSMRSGTAAARLLLPEAAKGYGRSGSTHRARP